MTMNLPLVAHAWTELVYLDLIGLLGFRRIRRVVRPLTRPSHTGAPPESTVKAVVEAVATARTIYVKPVMCLQESAVVTRLLRRRGIAADLVIGCHLAPFRSHAWVEVAGEVVTEKVEAMEYYCILDRW